jgi:pimeloyl-ACP methyl ester carboxylesterase
VTTYSETFWSGQDGLRLYARVYESTGNASATVLCLHGLTRNSRDFEDLAPHLQSRYRVIVPDMRGRGRSMHDPQPQNYQPAVYVQDILALLDAVNESRVRVIGTSMGGMLAMMMGVSYRDRIAGLVLNDMGPEVDPKGLDRIKGYAGRMPAPKNWNEAVAQTKTMFGDAWPNLPAERWLTLTRRAYREDAAGYPKIEADPMIGEMLRAAPAATANLWPFWNELRGIPMLSIRGEKSDILSAATCAQMKAQNPELQQLEVANRGHAPLLDEPECIAAIDAFLARNAISATACG